MELPIRPVRAVVHATQSVVYLVMAFGVAAIWWVDSVALVVAAAGQGWAVAGGLAGNARSWRAGNLVSLVAVGLLLARYLTQSLHVIRTFGDIAGEAAWGAAGNLLLTLPWALAVPVVALWPERRAVIVMAACVLPLAEAARPYPAWSAELAAEDAPGVAEALAAGLWAQWNGREVVLPALPDDALVLITPVRDGKPAKTRCGRGAEIASVVAALEAVDGRSSLIVDMAVQRLPSGWMRLGTDAPATDCPRSPALYPREKVPRVGVFYGHRLPYAPEGAIRFESALVSADGVSRLDAGWTPGRQLNAEGLREAVRAGATHLMRNMSDQGRFTYIVRSPSGTPDKGYNWPRHAGTAWFLARAATELDDPSLRDAARRSLAYMKQYTVLTADGRGFINDPSRRDGRAWVGTTALAALAAIEEGGDPALRDAFLRHVAASVDEQGHVRSEVDVETGDILPSTTTAYGQGQGMLALANGVRYLGEDSPEGVTEALDRSLGFLASGYLGSAHPWAVGDEHWLCLVAHAVHEARGPANPGVIAAHQICATYLFKDRTPPDKDSQRPTVNGAGGLAEAITAHAWDTADSNYREVAYGYARVFLASQYMTSDAPLLVKPQSLIGGLRPGPGDLDVQIDTVQHASCALLGVLAFEDGDRRARLP